MLYLYPSIYKIVITVLLCFSIKMTFWLYFSVPDLFSLMKWNHFSPSCCIQYNIIIWDDGSYLMVFLSQDVYIYKCNFLYPFRYIYTTKLNAEIDLNKVICCNYSAVIRMGGPLWRISFSLNIKLNYKVAGICNISTEFLTP